MTLAVPAAGVADVLVLIATGVADTLLGSAMMPSVAFSALYGVYLLINPSANPHHNDGDVLRSALAQTPAEIEAMVDRAEDPRYRSYVIYLQEDNVRAASELALTFLAEGSSEASFHFVVSHDALGRGDLDLSIAHAREAIRLGSGKSWKLAVRDKNLLAYALVLQGKPERLQEAKRLAEDAFRGSQLSEIGSTLGAVLVHVGQAQRGVRLLEQGLSAANKPHEIAETLYFITLGHLAMDNAVAAFDAYTRALATGCDPRHQLQDMQPFVGAAIAAHLTRAANGSQPFELTGRTDKSVTARAAIRSWLHHEESERLGLFEASGGDPEVVSMELVQAITKLMTELPAAQPSQIEV